jgi:hypothetical protein
VNNFKATPEQWYMLEQYATTHCAVSPLILELRARVEALEAQGRNYPETPDSSTPPPVATDEELKDIMNRAGTSWIQDVRAIYNLGIEHGQAGSREVAELRAELERERIRLAACGVVAKADTPESAKKARDMHPDYHSASLDDVISMVDALMAERAKQAHSREVAEPAPVAGGLVERVSWLIAGFASRSKPGDDCKPTAVKIVVEAAKWLRSHGISGSAKVLEQEAGR